MMNENVDLLMRLLPFMIPLVLAELTLKIVALIHILRHPNYRMGNRVMWIVIVILVNTLGSILYFLIGRGED